MAVANADGEEFCCLDARYFEKLLIDQEVHFRGITQVQIKRFAERYTVEQTRYYHVVVEYEKPSTRELKEKYFTVKQMHKDQTHRNREESMREVMMYRSIIPLMENALKAAGVYSPLAPKYYDSNVGRRYILLDDIMSGSKYELIDPARRLSFEELKLSLTGIARWHAASLKIMNQLTKIQMNRIIDNHDTDKDMYAHDLLMLNTFECCIEMLEEEEGFRDIIAKLMQLRQKLPRKFIEARKFSFGGINVIGHGDFWSNSVLFAHESYNEEHLPVFHEFQMVRLQSPIFDVANILFTSADPDMDAVGYDRLIDWYAEEFVKAQDLLAVPRTKLISNVDIFREFDARSCFGIIYAICAMPLRQQRDTPNDTWTQFFDGTPRGADFRRFMYSDELTRKCVKNLLRYAEKSGYLSSMN